MADNLNTIQGTEIINVNDAVQGSHAITLDTLKTFVATVLTNGSGTTANGTAVDLGGTTAGGNIDIDTATNGSSRFSIFGAGTGVGINYNSGISQIGDVLNNGNGNLFTIDDANNLAYYRNGADAAFFGINTNAPTVALEVLGDIINSGGGSRKFYTSNFEVGLGDIDNNSDGNKFIIFGSGDTAYYKNTANNGRFGINTDNPQVALDVVGAAAFTGPVRLAVTTVGALPGGNQGDMMMVTDALAPAYGVAVAAGGAVVTKVFYNGAAWIVG